MKFWKKLYETFVGHEKLSDAALTVGKVFEEENTSGQAFFYVVVARFENFDEFNRSEQDNNFCTDVQFIAECVDQSLSAIEDLYLFSTRIDSYFYIYRRLEEYLYLLKAAKSWSISSVAHPIDKVKRMILANLTEIFSKDKGLQPNLCISSKDQLQRIRISEHLKSVSRLDKEKVNQFFALCKLSLQSSKYTDEHPPRWLDVLSRVKQFDVSLEEFISCYTSFALGFSEFKLDVTAFIFLVMQLHPPIHIQESPFCLFIRLCRSLDIKAEDFFTQFQPIFQKKCKENWYRPSDIAHLLSILGRQERIFNSYLTIATASFDTVSIWSIFLYLCEKSEFSQMIQNALLANICNRVVKTTPTSFLLYDKLADTCIKKLPHDRADIVRKFYASLFNAFVNTQLKDERYSYYYSESNLKDFLSISLRLYTTIADSLQQSSCLLLLQSLLFRTSSCQKNPMEKIYTLFRKITDLDRSITENIDPLMVIQDDWLSESLLMIPADLTTHFTANKYSYLCESHRDNAWVLHVWSRILQLSFLRVKHDHINETLWKLNDWMKIVKHDVYDPNYRLTIIFIKNLFEFLIMKYSGVIVQLPKIDCIVGYILVLKDGKTEIINKHQMNNFIQTIQDGITKILSLEGKWATYRECRKQSIIHCFLEKISLNEVLQGINPQHYKFPLINQKIAAVLPMIPKDIDIIQTQVAEEFYSQLICQTNQWLDWFEENSFIFLNILHWLKKCNVDAAAQLFSDLQRSINDMNVSLTDLKSIFAKVLVLLQPFHELPRLCLLLNCLMPFHVIESATLNPQTSSGNFIREMKRAEPKNSFQVEKQKIDEYVLTIQDRRYVCWAVAAERWPCSLSIDFTREGTVERHEKLYEGQDAVIDKFALTGAFETQKGGIMSIVIDNTKKHNPRTIWFRIKQTPLSTCHLFHGIFKMHYEKKYGANNMTNKSKDISELLDKVFQFIDNLLDGKIRLRDMTDLKALFCDKNINIKEEVKLLFSSRAPELNGKELGTTTNPTTSEREIEVVCEWLQIYQYYSHVNIILKCIETFEILPTLDTDDSATNLQRLTDENCDLKQIAHTYKILKQRFQKLKSQHLQLIKVAAECPAVVALMKRSNLYSTQGRRRFQELRDNLTTQFQLQERNNMILNSWIITYGLCEPFVEQVQKLDDFIEHVASMPKFDENSLTHLHIINDNIQIVSMWLSAEEATVLDNALITMEHLYRSGIVHMHFRRLMNEESYMEIEYSISKLQSFTRQISDSEELPEQRREDAGRIKFTLTMSDIDDHKRQLTFCNVDLNENMLYKKLLLQEQLVLLRLVSNIYSLSSKLEMAGHPKYQLRDEQFFLFDSDGKFEGILTGLKNEENFRTDRLEATVKMLYEDLKLRYDILDTNYRTWNKCLENHRQETPLLQLFSNRQVMILIILLSDSTGHETNKHELLKKLSPDRYEHLTAEEEMKLTIHYLTHYLRSLRLHGCDLKEDRIQRLLKNHKIDPNSDVNDNLKKLCKFLNEVYNNGHGLLKETRGTRENLQYLVCPEKRNRMIKSSPFDHELDIDTVCILINIYQHQLPSSFQILWCSTATEDDIYLFFSRIRTFRHLIFVVLEIDGMHHRLREILLNEQDALTKYEKLHASVYYFSRELTCRKGLRPFIISPKCINRDSSQTIFSAFFRTNDWALPHTDVICGAAGIGKTHKIKTMIGTQTTLSLSINDRLNLSKLIHAFLVFDSSPINPNPTVFLNISMHAPFTELNRALFSLLICGSLVDTNTGLIFSLPIDMPWKFLLEIPYNTKFEQNIIDNVYQLIPLLFIVAPNHVEEVTNVNNQLHIGEDEELIARFLKAYNDETIDQLMIEKRNGDLIPVAFDQLDDISECRRQIQDCIRRYAPHLSKNKISELTFTKFLLRRIRFFTNLFYTMNTTNNELGSTAMRQMIEEAIALSSIDFKNQEYPRVFLVYDPEFALHLLHDDWNRVHPSLKRLFKNQNPTVRSEADGKNHFVKCLAWLINIRYENFEQIMDELNFILTENFTYKLFHIHERKLTKLALIIEGHTGVGKTFLLKFYSLLLNANVTKGPIDNDVNPGIRERTSIWLANKIISNILENHLSILSEILQKVKPKLVRPKNADDDERPIPNARLATQLVFLDDEDQNELEDQADEVLHQPELPFVSTSLSSSVTHLSAPLEEQDGQQNIDRQFLDELHKSLYNYKYSAEKLQHLWRKILRIAYEKAPNIYYILLEALYEYVSSHLTRLPLIEASVPLQNLLKNNNISEFTIENGIEIFDEFLLHTEIKPLFYRLLLHPGVTEEQLEEFMRPVCQLANRLPDVELVVFFDEVNTSSCLGLFKEIFIDKTLHGKALPVNIFFTAAINPFIKVDDTEAVHRRDYLVHELPQSLDNLKVVYGTLEPNSLREYIEKKISKFCEQIERNASRGSALEQLIHGMLTDSIINAQEFCEKYLGHNSVSQREIQRCFNLIEFFWRMRFDNGTEYDQNSYRPDHQRCIALAIALIYYFRLPTKEDNVQRKDHGTPPREELARILSKSIPDFSSIIHNELENFVNADNFKIPEGVAINQAIREHIFAIVVCIVSRTPLCIIGAPGQSKTLSFQIVLQNLQGAQLSPKNFCKSLPSIDPFFCLGSKYSRSEDIAYVFERAIKREQNYQQNRINTRCVVFLDEASLPDEKKMVLKVLHPYLDECKVAFVAIANKSFDAANANRMICIYRSLPSEDDQKILAYGCLGLQIGHKQQSVNDRLNKIIYGLCLGYRQVLISDRIPRIYHDRDFIYMLRELRFELNPEIDEQQARVDGISSDNLLRALEDNFNGIHRDQFEILAKTFFDAVHETCGNFRLPTKRRNVPTILRESMQLDSIRRRLYGRYKLIIDESEDESAVRLLIQSGVLDLDPNKTTVFRMSDFPEDIDNELRNVEILSTIKLCMETGKTILMVNTGRIHGSLYDVFNQNFSIMATDDNRKIWSKVAIGPKTIDVVVHEDFQCIVHIKRSEFDQIPAPFLSRFQKYSLSVNDFYQIQLQQLSRTDQRMMNDIEQKARTFIEHFGREYFYGLNEHTLYSCLLSFIKKNETDNTNFVNVHQQYTQLSLKSKSFIELNPTDTQQCLLRAILSKLIQLVSPESIILKLPSFEESFARSMCTNYFQQQEHFSIENFVQHYTSLPYLDADQQDFLGGSGNVEQVPIDRNYQMTTKVMIFTRTSSNIMGLNEQSKQELFSTSNPDDPLNQSEKIVILNLSMFENSNELEDSCNKFEKAPNKNLLIVVINTRTVQQCSHIPYVRQLIDKAEYRCNVISKQQKFFLLLIHSPPQTIYHQSSFPSIFLHDWDFYFFDTCLSGNAFHLQKFLQIIISSNENRFDESSDQMLCDLNSLFDNCLWDFCSRIQIFLQDLPKNMFDDEAAYEFYSRQTSSVRRVQCLKQILHRSAQLQKRILEIYHTHLAMKKDSSKKIYTMIYQISKDILCGKRFDGLVDSLQSQTRISFTNFVSNIFKYIVNDYGLDTLPKLSDPHGGYGSMLDLIDYSSFVVDNANNVLATQVSETFQLVTHYACIPQTPLYHVFHQRVKSHADEIKQIMIQKQIAPEIEREDQFRRHYYSVPSAATPATTMMADLTNDDDNRRGEYQFEEFRFALMKSMMKDQTLIDTVNDQVLRSYSNDLVQTCCTIVEKNFENDLIQYKKTIEFVSRWLLLVDENDQRLLDETRNKNMWLLAHGYASFDYDHHDLFSLYSACRIMDGLDPTRSFYEELFMNDSVTRTSVREGLFRRMFDYLWENLVKLCMGTGTDETWIVNYTLISKYYPSDKVLQYSRLVDIGHRIEFMNLAYLILFNDKIPNRKALVKHLMDSTGVSEDAEAAHHAARADYKERFALIIQCVHQYFEENHADDSSLMLDIQQWIVTTLKSVKQSCQDEIRDLFGYLQDLNCPLSWSIKKFLFDELAALCIEQVQRNRAAPSKAIIDFWNRFVTLLPILIDCIPNINSLANYQVPHHPSIMNQATPRPALIDLFFFYIKRLTTEEVISCEIVNKIILSNTPAIRKRNQMESLAHIFKQFKDYFLVYLTAIVVCQPNTSDDDQQVFERILRAIIREYLSVNENIVQLTPSQEIFFSVIISKRSWNYLLNFLQSNRMQQCDYQWSNTFQRLFSLTQNAQANDHLQLSHQLQFALSPDANGSIFPTLHQPYAEVREIIDHCIQITDEDQRWIPLTSWIQRQQLMNPQVLQPVQIKVLLLLNIYYNYYCQNRLEVIRPVLTIVENHLKPLPEELLVFRAIIDPERSMVGYPRVDEREETNQLNRLFTLNFNEGDEMGIRHCMVNLMAMILLGGKQSFLWTFAFEPASLERTFGFGSTAHNVISRSAVHYDCGCILSVNGDLLQFSNQPNRSVLNVPAIYVVYFATFGAMAWHLLLNEQSVDNLHGPILAPHAVGDNSNIGRMAGQNLRTKVCHFIRARLISSIGFLSNRFNQDDACILMNRSFERMAFLTVNRDQPGNSWIKTVYATINDQLDAEKQYQEQVFFHVHQKLEEFKEYINHLNLQSEIQTNLQLYINQSPIIIDYQHFKTEIHNPIHSGLSLNILRYILNSSDFLSITQSIYDLSQFYLLIHETYSLLIERDEFTKITLEELYKRGQNHYRQSDHLFNGQKNNDHMFIIKNGIKAVNDYYRFTDGLIQPGACDVTQRFTQISLDTTVNNLVTTGSHEDNNIIMRILSVLVDYHDGVLNLLEKEFNNNDDGNASILKNLVNKLTSKEVSILQIARDNTGVITLTKEDFYWIEQLSRASLQDDNGSFFHTATSRLNFDFLHIQSFAIRSYLLLCRINYRHIEQRYQCHVRRQEVFTEFEPIELSPTYLQPLDPQQIEQDWNHLRQLPFDLLSQGHRLLRQIMLMIQTKEDDHSKMTLSEFIEEIIRDRTLIGQMHALEIKNFQLCFINHVRELYLDSIRDFQYLFNDISQLLHAPIRPELDETLNNTLHTHLVDIDYHDNVEKLKSTIQTITELLNDIRAAETSFLHQAAQPLSETCKHLSIENPILGLLTNEIKCENYVAFSIHLIRIRAILQERAVNIKEKEQKLWFETFDKVDDMKQQKNRFQDFLNAEEPTKEEEKQPDDLNNQEEWNKLVQDANENIATTTDYFTDEDEQQFIRIPKDKTAIETAPVDESIDYKSLFELHLKIVPWTSSSIFDRLHQIRQSLSTPPTEVSPKVIKITIQYPDGKPVPPSLSKPEGLFEKFKKIFIERKYDENLLALIDKDQILVDFMNPNIRLTYPIPLEYAVVDRSSLIEVEFCFKESAMKYWTSPTATLIHVIQRFLSDYQTQLPSLDRSLGFFNTSGKVIDDLKVGDLVCSTTPDGNENEQTRKKVDIIVIDEEDQNNALCEIRLRSPQGEEQTELFYHRSTWDEVDGWLKSNRLLSTLSTNDFNYFDREKIIIIDHEQSIGVILEPRKSAIVDGIRQDSTIKVTFTFENNSYTTCALKSMKIDQLLNDEKLSEKLNLINLSTNDLVLVLGETTDQMIPQEDFRKSLTEYLNDGDQTIHFRVSILVQIFRDDQNRFEQKPLFNTRIKLNELFQMVKKPDEDEKYLASHRTKKILDFNENFSNLNENKFIIVEKHQISLVQIRRLIDVNEANAQQFMSTATIADVCRGYDIDLDNECLIYENDFVPSTNTSLNIFRSKSPVEFTVANENFPIHVVIENTMTNQKVKFHCSLSTKANRLYSIAFLLFGIRSRFYQLFYDDSLLDNDDQLTIEDFHEENVTEVKLKLKSTAEIRSSIRYGEQTILLPCDSETKILDLMSEVFEQLNIPMENMPMFELFLLDDEMTQLDLDFTIGDLSDLFNSKPETISIELKKKD